MRFASPDRLEEYLSDLSKQARILAKANRQKILNSLDKWWKSLSVETQKDYFRETGIWKGESPKRVPVNDSMWKGISELADIRIFEGYTEFGQQMFLSLLDINLSSMGDKDRARCKGMISDCQHYIRKVDQKVKLALGREFSLFLEDRYYELVDGGLL